MRPTILHSLLAMATLGAAAPAQWHPLSLGVRPPQAIEPLLAYDAFGNRTLLLTGYNGPDRQFWSFDGASWTQLQPNTMPTQRRGANMAYDLSSNTLVLFGGQVSSPTSVANSPETWIWDGTDWRGAQPCPVGLARHGMVADYARGRIVVYGGSPNVFAPVLSDATWEFDGAAWTNTVAGSPPGAREFPAMCYAAGLGQTVLFGGAMQGGGNDETWLYDGAQWTLAPVVGPRPAPRTGAQMVYDPARQVCLLVGGEDLATGAILDDTWEFDGAGWREVGPGVAPARRQFGMTHDLLRGRPVLFGGRLAGGAVRDDTWEYSASHRIYGTGCTGTWGAPALVPGAVPVLGGTASLAMTGLDPAASFAFMVVGLSRTTSTLGPLPTSLTTLGLTGCVAYASPDVFAVLGASGGTATWTWQVPADQVLFGQSFYQQGLSIDPTRNAAGLVTSDANLATIGW